MKKFVFILTVLSIAVSTTCAQNSPAEKTEIVKPNEQKSAAQTKSDAPKTEREKFKPAANASVDLQAAIQKAQKENKRIVLDVGGEWCVWCREMDNFLIRNADLNRLRGENYVWLKINFSEENENKEFLAAYPQVKGYPHLFVLEKDGKFLYSKDTSELEDGKKSYNLEKFTAFLNEYAPKRDAAK